MVQPIETFMDRRQLGDVFIIHADIVQVHFTFTEIDQQRFRFFRLSKADVFDVLVLFIVLILLLLGKADERVERRQRTQMTIDIWIFDPFVGIDRRAWRIALLHNGEK